MAVVVVATTAFVRVPLSIATYAVATAVSLLPASLIAVVALTLSKSVIPRRTQMSSSSIYASVPRRNSRSGMRLSAEWMRSKLLLLLQVSQNQASNTKPDSCSVDVCSGIISCRPLYAILISSVLDKTGTITVGKMVLKKAWSVDT